MSADTAAKRFSAMSVTLPWRGVAVVPSASITQGERQAVMFMYSGILAGGAVPPAPSNQFGIPTIPDTPQIPTIGQRR